LFWQEFQLNKREFIIVVYLKNDVIAKNLIARKNIVNASTQEYYVRKPVSALIVEITINKMTKMTNKAVKK